MSTDAWAWYRHALRRAETRAAQAEHEHAGVALELARIRERLAEIKSQHQPLARLMDCELSDKDKAFCAAHYVVVGTMPGEDR